MSLFAYILIWAVFLYFLRNFTNAKCNWSFHVLATLLNEQMCKYLCVRLGCVKDFQMANPTCSSHIFFFLLSANLLKKSEIRSHKRSACFEAMRISYTFFRLNFFDEICFYNRSIFRYLKKYFRLKRWSSFLHVQTFKFWEWARLNCPSGTFSGPLRFSVQA